MSETAPSSDPAPRPPRPVRVVGPAPRRPGPRRPAGLPRTPARAPADPRSPWRNPWFRLILLGLGLLLVAALIVDLSGAVRRGNPERARIEALESPEAYVLGLSDQRYVDPEGRFALTMPAAWIPRDGDAADPYTAGFRGPGDIDISILVSDLPHDRFDLLMAQIRGQEQHLDVKMNIRQIEFQGRPAVERHSRLTRVSLYLLDFMDGHRAYHVVANMPREDYEKLLPVVKEVLDTLEAPAGRRWPPSAAPAAPDPPAADAPGPAAADAGPAAE